MSELNELTITEAKALLASGKISATELCKFHLDKMEAAKDLNMFVTTTPEIALAQAQKSEAKIKAGTAGLLEGIPVAVKDLFATNGVMTTSCSKILDGFVPFYESTVTSKMFDQGAVMLGKTNMDEFAMGSSTITSYYGPTINPLLRNDNDAKLVPGGSSGGSSAAVAAYVAMASLGSDTGGSVRQPASFCGLVGIKPTYGRCSRYGMFAFASSLDQAGTFTRSVDDAALMLSSIMGHDDKDSTSANIALPNLLNIDGDVKGMRIGIPKEYDHPNISDEIRTMWRQAADKLKSLGAEIIDITLPNSNAGLATYYIIACAEASSNLSRYDGVRYGLRNYEEGMSLDEMYESTRSEGFGREVKRRILLGTYVLSAGYYDAYYTKAQRVRKLIADDFRNAFEKCDVILTPTAPSEAFAIGEKMDDPVQMYLNDIFTIPASLAGLPVSSVPGGVSKSGLPLGLHLIAKPFDEFTLFRASKAVEDISGFDLKTIRSRVRG